MPVKDTIALVGGDDRELILIRELFLKGFRINVFGFPAGLLPNGVKIYNTVRDAVEGTRVIILPMPGIKDNGILYAKYVPHPVQVSEQDLAGIDAKACVFVGAASPYLKSVSQRLGFVLKEIAEQDTVAIPNAVPTAEGAIQLAMEKLPITVHGSESFIIGFGRVADALASMLKGIGAYVTVLARNPAQLERCRNFGYKAVRLENLSQVIGEADVIFNTVPAPVIGENILSSLRKSCLIIDLASAPGGTDFTSAQKLGICAILASGLPGKVAPVTAGKILANVYPELISSWLFNL